MCVCMLCRRDAGAAQGSVMLQNQAAGAELAALRAIQELEEAARRAAAAARRQYKQGLAVYRCSPAAGPAPAAGRNTAEAELDRQ